MPSATLRSPIGIIRIEAEGERLTAIRIDPETPGATLVPPQGPILSAAAAQLEAYFAGRLEQFDLPLTPAATDRGAALRDAIAAIAPGVTASYGALARSAGSSPRAIGQACARNPFPIVIPCHRVTGAGGALGHYSAGNGVATKRWLLDHERRDG